MFEQKYFSRFKVTYARGFIYICGQGSSNSVTFQCDVIHENTCLVFRLQVVYLTGNAFTAIQRRDLIDTRACALSKHDPDAELVNLGGGVTL